MALFLERWIEVKRRPLRFLKLKGLQLLRSPGGPRMVATGFSIGLAVEFITLITFGVAFFLIFPLIKLFRGSFAAALVGFVFGKLILTLFLPIGYKLGNTLFHYHVHGVPHVIQKYLSTLSGMLLLGIIAGLVMYFPVYYLYSAFHKQRQLKRKMKKSGQIKAEVET